MLSNEKNNDRDLRISLPKLFGDAFNSFDFKEMSKFFKSYCIEDFIFYREIIDLNSDKKVPQSFDENKIVSFKGKFFQNNIILKKF